MLIRFISLEVFIAISIQTDGADFIKTNIRATFAMALTFDGCGVS